MDKRKPLFVKTLMILTAFQALSGLWGGLCLTIDPSGRLMMMPLSFLDDSPFNSFLVPGIILFIFVGVIPAIAFRGMIKPLDSAFFEKVNIYKNNYWAWTFSLYSAIILILWIDFQVMFIGYLHIIQTIYALLGIVLLINSLLPSVIHHYKLPE